MNRLKLIDELEKRGVPNRFYSTKGGGEDKVCIDILDGVWTVYYQDRGIRSVLGEFDSESKACEFMLEKLS